MRTRSPCTRPRPVTCIVADGPAGLDDLSRALLILADYAFLPIAPSILDIRSVQQAMTTLQQARGINAGHPEWFLLLNKIRLRDRISRELQFAAPKLGIRAARHFVRDLQAFRDAPQQATVVTRMKIGGLVRRRLTFGHCLRKSYPDDVTTANREDGRGPMPKECRSIDKALELTPEATAFIRGDSNPQSAASEKPVPADGSVSSRKRKRLRRNGHIAKQTQTNNPSVSQQASRLAEYAPPHSGFLVPITTRIHLETADALRRACLEQKLHRKLPNTQQEIIEVALCSWLIGNFY